MDVIAIEDLDRAARAVEEGRLVVLPTRRWYMLCASALRRDVCDRIFSGKGRARTKSLAFVLPSKELANELFVMPPYASRLAAAFWPGDLALVLTWRDVDYGRAREAVGVPAALVMMDPGALGVLARQTAVPIAATTVNVSNPSDTRALGPAITIEEVQQFVDESGLEVAYCVDGGICPLAHHLTVVDCTGGAPVITRQGVVHERAIHAALTAGAWRSNARG